MRPSVLLIALVCVGAIVAGQKDPKDQAGKAGPGSLSVGKDLPGPFHPYNVTGPRKDNFSCMVSANGLNPGVLVFVRGNPDAEDASLKDLLQKLDNAVEKNPNVRLGVGVVFVPEELKDVVNDDDTRTELAGKIEDIAKAAMLKHVVLGLTNRDDAKAYALPETAGYTVLLYHKYQIQGLVSLDKDKLTMEKIQAILTLVGEKLGATRK